MTEKFFKFPIRVYDGFSVAKAIAAETKRFENEQDMEEPEPTNWVGGFARIPIKKIAAWFDHFEEGMDPAEVANKGFEMTMVLTKGLGTFECLWKREKFEQELDKFTKNPSII